MTFEGAGAGDGGGVCGGRRQVCRQTRNFAPQRHAVFASSAVNQGARAAAALLVENLAFMEMPWFAGLDARRAELDSPEERTLPAAQQDFLRWARTHAVRR